jgi:hypothetical protein
MKKLLIFVFLGLCCFHVPKASATTRYVRNGSGNGCSNGTTTYNPATDSCGSGSATVYTTFVAGVSATFAGDILIVRAGTYSETLDNRNNVVNNGTSFSNAVTIQNYGNAGAYNTGEKVIIAGQGGAQATVYMSGGNGTLGTVSAVQYIIFDGIWVDAHQTKFGVSLGNFNRYTHGDICCVAVGLTGNPLGMQGVDITGGLHNNEVTYSQIHDLSTHQDDQGGGNCCQGAHGGYIGGDNNLFDHLTIYNVGQHGIQFYHFPDASSAHDNTFSNNIIHNTGTSGINGACADAGIAANNKIFNNVCYNSHFGFSINGTGGGDLFYSNTIYNIVDYAFYLSVGTATVRNNLAKGAARYFLADGTMTNSNNVCDTAGSNCNTVDGTTNLMVDPANANFRPCTGSGSPSAPCTGASGALNAGFTLGSPYNVDIVGTARPDGTAYDAGAYEGTSGVAPPTCPTTPVLVASYGFEGNGTDTSGTGNLAVLGGGLTYTTGKFGQGVLMNGSALISVSNSTSLFLCSAWTISAQIKVTAPLTDYATIVSKVWNDTSSTEGRYYLYAGSSGFCAAGGILGGYGSQATSNVTACYSTPIPADGNFHSVAVTYDSSLGANNIKLWVDGVNVTAGNGTTVIGSSTGQLDLGGSQYGEYLPSGTVLDEVRIYNYARTQAQLQSDAATAIVPTGGPPVIIKIGSAASALKLGAAAAGVKFGGGQ